MTSSSASRLVRKGVADAQENAKEYGEDKLEQAEAQQGI
eukprot:gene26226-14810_t